MTELPEYSLLSLYEDDTMSVICHWHRQPTDDEVSDMIDSLDADELIDMRGVLIARTIAFKKGN